jgi:hypothetical protein
MNAEVIVSKVCCYPVDLHGFVEVAEREASRACSVLPRNKASLFAPDKWWIVIAVVHPLVERVKKTFVPLLGMDVLVCEQRLLLT